MFIPDTLSRATYKKPTNHKDEFEVYTTDVMPISDQKRHVLRQATDENIALQKLKRNVICGCPDTKDDVDQDVKPNWTFQ